MSKTERFNKLDELTAAVYKAAHNLKTFVAKHGPRKETKQLDGLKFDLDFWLNHVLEKAL